MSTLNPYLYFNGNCEEAFTFYKTIFGGEFSYLSRMKDAPGSDELSDEDKNRIMHISLPIGEETLMGADLVSSFGMINFVEGNNTHLSINAKNPEEAKKLFDGLSEGGIVLVPLAEQFWGEMYGNLKDKFGIFWMISSPLGTTI